MVNCKKLNNYKYCLFFCLLSGILFCLSQLICVQLGIIILNALFNEIVDEFRLLADNINKKEYNFYEKLEIASYKSIPEIDVGIFWSFIGIIFLKKYGFNWGNIFQFFSLVGFILLFLLFDFQIDDKLSNNYTQMEFAVLIISYIFSSITVGASSMIALKQFSSLYFNFYKKNFDLFKYINIFYWLCYLLFSLIKCIIKKICKGINLGEGKTKQKEKNLQQIFFILFLYSLLF